VTHRRDFGIPDFILIGAGAAGCVLANRLSTDPGTKVLLIEAGGYGFAPVSDIPLGIGLMRGSRRYDWCYSTVPEPHLAGRRLSLPQGRTVGGSSAINGMVYLRGQSSDFEEWAALGNRRWAWHNVRPYFEKLEKGDMAGAGNALPASAGGLLHPLDRALLAAADDAGFPRSPGFNQTPDGFGRFDFNILNGRRHTGWRAHLRPSLRRPNLSVLTDTTVTRILFNGRQAVGVQTVDSSGKQQRIAGSRIVLCAGAIGSPKLLLLSGLGEPQELRKLGIDMVASLSGVGRNLQNHPDVAVRHDCLRPITLHSLLRADRMAFAWARAWFMGTGPASAFPGSAGAFLRSRPELPLPDLECHLVWARRIAGPRLRLPLRPRHDDERDGFSVRISLLRPESRGRVWLASSDAKDAPLIRFNYLESAADSEALVRGIGIMRHVLSQTALNALRGYEREPGVSARSDADLSRWVRQNLDNQGHPVGTCRMGSDEEAVVDESLAVRGIDKLWIADSSVMPLLPRANTYATTAMIAEVAADILLGRCAAS